MLIILEWLDWVLGRLIEWLFLGFSFLDVVVLVFFNVGVRGVFCLVGVLFFILCWIGFVSGVVGSGFFDFFIILFGFLLLVFIVVGIFLFLFL